ncbi:unnamed protein product, partial [Urochloa humidicola]
PPSQPSSCRCRSPQFRVCGAGPPISGCTTGGTDASSRSSSVHRHRRYAARTGSTSGSHGGSATCTRGGAPPGAGSSLWCRSRIRRPLHQRSAPPKHTTSRVGLSRGRFAADTSWRRELGCRCPFVAQADVLRPIRASPCRFVVLHKRSTAGFRMDPVRADSELPATICPSGGVSLETVVTGMKGTIQFPTPIPNQLLAGNEETPGNML